jgi:hypothetical protein
VLERIHSKVQADYRVYSPRPGSWALDVVLVNALPLVQMLVQVPIDVMVAYVVNKLVPADRARHTAVEIERERTAQSREETRRLEIIAQNDRIAIEALSQALERAQVNEDRLVQAIESHNELSAAVNQEILLRDHLGEIEAKTSEQTRARLISKSRGQIVEIGKPLLRSAEDMRINGENGHPNIAFLNRRIVTGLGGQVQDDVAVSVQGNIIGYQKETGWGKFRHPEYGRPISFVVPGGKKSVLNSKVIDAMKENHVLAVYYNVRDANGNVKYLILEDIIDPENE